MGTEVFKMGTSSDDDPERLTLTVDDRGRITVPKQVRERLGIEPNDSVPATLVGSVLEIDPQPSSGLLTATAGRDDWTDSTPTDAGDALFGPIEHEPSDES